MNDLRKNFEYILSKRCIGKGKVMIATPHNIEVERVNITGFIDNLIYVVAKRDQEMIKKIQQIKDYNYHIKHDEYPCANCTYNEALDQVLALFPIEEIEKKNETD